MNRTSTLTALLFAAAASGEASSIPAPRPAELHLAIAGDPKTFNPLQVTDENSEIVRYLTGGTLLRIDRVTDQVRPELAESWTIDKKGQSISFRLRSGLRFSDGTSLTAEDVARTLRMAFDPQNSSPTGDVFRSEQGLPDIDVVSPKQITIRYPTTKAGLERLFDELYIAPPPHGNGATGTPGVSASAGPFFVADYRSGVAVTLKRNPYYWKLDGAGRPLPYLDAIRLDIQTNHDIEAVRFERGEIQMIRKIDPENFDLISKQEPSAARDLGPSMDSEFLWFNQAPSALPEWKQKWFGSTAFRHAISTAIDREDLARIAYKGHAHPAAGPLSPANRFWFNPELKTPRFDPEFAMRTLRSEGFVLRGGVLRDQEGHDVEFSMVTNSGNRTRQAIAALIQADLSRIGIRVNIVTLDFGALVERISKTSQYEACLLGFTNMAEDPIDQMNVWLSSGPQHAWRPSQKSPSTQWEARIDRLVLAQASEPSRDLRRKAFNEVQRILVEQEPVIYLVNPDSLSAIAPSLHGVRSSALFPQTLSNVESLSLQ
jgi:peptide/nickel transport system substrate-binding protein